VVNPSLRMGNGRPPRRAPGRMVCAWARCRAATIFASVPLLRPSQTSNAPWSVASRLMSHPYLVPVDSVV